ncbi:MAG: NACHT domain-containing NTPase [Crocosphaera sp.]
MNFDTFDKLTEELKKLITEIYGQEPAWLSPLINYILVAILGLCFIWGLLVLLSKIRKVWIEEFWPLFYKQEQKRRRRKRQRFAQHIEHQLIQLNSREEWRDYRFTELEAEIEAEGKWKKQTIIPFIQTTQRGLRREKSLSKALECSSERLILVEGEPGSGKSVALRHVTQKLAKQASKSNNIKSVIPLYINLKKLERDSQTIDRNLIEDFVKKELNRINDRDIEEFLDNEFYRGVKEGTWLFLFDSFDELPEVLSSVESDQVIRNYAEAINAFLGGFNQCRGIIASRQFRGPKHLGWPRFRILPLEDRRLELIRKADLDPPIEKELIKQWRNASHDIRKMTKNPMFLSILCENMGDGIPFPKNTHSVFEIYLNKRLTRDQERLKKRFNLEPTEIKAIAEQVAFCMTLDQNLGLSPTRNAIRQGMRNAEFRVPGHFDKLLDALEYLKLTRSEEESIEEDKKFTFSHRRFQEYFATCVVLRDLERISPQKLLKDGRWRETTVVIFQTQPSETFTLILAEANKILTEMVGSVSGLIDDPRGYVSDELQQEKNSFPEPFSWPDGVIHLLGLLQDGFKNRLEDLGDNIQDQAERLLLSATVTGTLRDRKWGLEVAGITSQPVLVWLLRDAFSGESQWLKEVAYQQTARLGKIPDDIAAGIRRNLLRLFATGRLYKEYFTTEVHLSRLDNSEYYLNIFRLLRWIRPIDFSLHILLFMLIIYGFSLSFITNKLLYLVIVCLMFDFDKFYINYNSLMSDSIISSITESIFLLLSFLFFHNFSSLISDVNLKKQNELIFLTKSFKTILLLLVRFFTFPFLLFWFVFAVLSADMGIYTHPFWWSFLLLFPILYCFANHRKLLKICRTILSNYWTYLINILMLIVFIQTLSWAVQKLYIIADKTIDTIIDTILIAVVYKSILFLATMFWFPIIVSMCIFLSILCYRILSIWITDLIKWRKWITKKHHADSMMAENILNLMKLYNNSIFCEKLIIYSRENNLIVANEDSETMLKELALILEISISEGYTYNANIDKNSSSDFLQHWLKQYIRKDKYRLVKLGSEFLDELYILIEQIRVRQKTTENPNN